MVISEHEALILVTDLVGLLDDGHTVTLARENATTYVATIDDSTYTADSLKLAIFKVFAHTGKHFPEFHYPFQVQREEEPWEWGADLLWEEVRDDDDL